MELWEPEKTSQRELRDRENGTVNRSIRIFDEEQGTDNTWLPLIGHCAQIFAPRAESCVASAGEQWASRLEMVDDLSASLPSSS